MEGEPRMSYSPGREARLRPEFAYLYPSIAPDRWDSAAVMADRVVVWLLRRPNAGWVATDRILPPEHFDFRGDAPRPASLPDGQSRRSDSQLQDLERQATDAKKAAADAEHRADATVERAEELQEKSEELGAIGEEIRKKASEPSGVPPAKGKGKRG